MSKGHQRNRSTGALEDEAVAWVQKVESDETAPELVLASQRWRAQSAAHEAAFAEAKLVWDRIGAAGRAAHAQENFLTPLDALRARRRTINRRAVLGGGVATLAAVAAYGLIDPPLGLWPSLSELEADYRTRTGEQRNLTFAGDVAIELNTQTSLAVRPAQGTEDRIELIAGEASFAIPARAERSLMVFAASGWAVASAGRFDVRCITSGGRSAVDVTCFDGAVRTEHGGETATLVPGQRVRYDATGLGRIVTIDPIVASAWRRGIVEFRATPLAEAIEEINRYRPGRIVLTNPALAQKQISGRFRTDQMDRVLLQLEQAFNARLQRLPGGILLLS